MSGEQSALDPHGPAAEAILTLFNGFNAVSAIVLAAVVAALAYALLRRRTLPLRPDTLTVTTAPETERRTLGIIAALTALTVLTIAGLTLGSFLVGRLEAAMTEEEMMTVRVGARQWWWEFTYEDGDPSQQLVVANELHIPVGRPVRLKLLSNDVIHSFWVPALNGKKDLIPGRQNDLVIQADAPGVYRGQCAEFCGLQHSKMALLVIAEPADAFDAWRVAQLRPSSPPAEEAARRGQHVFLTSGCVMCHRVRGTPAGATNGPDLTHMASRRTLAAGSLPMTTGHLAGWIADPQGVKPGSKMPRVPLSGEDLRAVVSYLETLR